MHAHVPFAPIIFIFPPLHSHFIFFSSSLSLSFSLFYSIHRQRLRVIESRKRPSFVSEVFFSTFTSLCDILPLDAFWDVYFPFLLFPLRRESIPSAVNMDGVGCIYWLHICCSLNSQWRIYFWIITAFFFMSVCLWLVIAFVVFVVLECCYFSSSNFNLAWSCFLTK